jgi:hypothetical protein
LEVALGDASAGFAVAEIHLILPAFDPFIPGFSWLSCPMLALSFVSGHDEEATSLVSDSVGIQNTGKPRLPGAELSDLESLGSRWRRRHVDDPLWKGNFDFRLA